MQGGTSIETLEAFRFNGKLRSLDQPSDCAALFRSVTEPFGFDTFACGELDLRDRERSAFFLIDWPPAWAKFYRESGMIGRDPIIDELAFRRSPYSWADLRNDRKFAKAGRAALDLAAEAGWTDGLVIPLPCSANRVAVVSLAGQMDRISQATIAHVSVVSALLHFHVRTLVAKAGYALPPAGLTPREIMAIQLVARGMSDKEIGVELNVAESTAHEFVEKAKRRLKSKSRAELIAVAASLAMLPG